jgi:hypothetical protein
MREECKIRDGVNHEGCKKPSSTASERGVRRDICSPVSAHMANENFLIKRQICTVRVLYHSRVFDGREGQQRIVAAYKMPIGWHVYNAASA